MFASLATYDGPDPARLRYQNLNSNDVEIKIEEDTTLDSETDHTTEQVSFLALEGAGLLEAQAIPLLGEMDLTVAEGDAGTIENDSLLSESPNAFDSISSNLNSDSVELKDENITVMKVGTLNLDGRIAPTTEIVDDLTIRENGSLDVTSINSNSLGTSLIAEETLSNKFVDFEGEIPID